MKKNKIQSAFLFIVVIGIVTCSTIAYAAERYDDNTSSDSQTIPCDSVCNTSCCIWIFKENPNHKFVDLQPEIVLSAKEEAYTVPFARPIFHPPISF